MMTLVSASSGCYLPFWWWVAQRVEWWEDGKWDKTLVITATRPAQGGSSVSPETGIFIWISCSFSFQETKFTLFNSRLNTSKVSRLIHSTLWYTARLCICAVHTSQWQTNIPRLFVLLQTKNKLYLLNISDESGSVVSALYWLAHWTCYSNPLWLFYLRLYNMFIHTVSK